MSACVECGNDDPCEGYERCSECLEKTGVQRYRKLPVEVEAAQLLGETRNDMDVYHWIERNTQGSFDPYGEMLPGSGVSIDPATGFMLIATLEGVMQAKPGDFVVRGVQGEFYPCKPDIFEATYEPAVAV